MYQSRPLTRPVADVLASAPAGNAYSDHDLWSELYRIALNAGNPTATRAAAIRKMDELTGCPESAGKDDDTLVTDFVTASVEQCEIEPFTAAPD